MLVRCGNLIFNQTLTDLVNQINENMSPYKLDSEQRLTHFFAQARTEIGPKFNLVERLDYAREPLKNTFSYFRHHPAEVDLYCRNSQHSEEQE